MSQIEMKTYVLMISRVFPATHPRRGQETHFKQKIMLGVKEPDVPYDLVVHGKNQRFILDTTSYKNELAFNEGWAPKRHTIRLNYDLWARRAEKINNGESVLSLRQWTGKPYASKQQEFLRLEKISVQRVNIHVQKDVHNTKFGKSTVTSWVVLVDGKEVSEKTLATNDGLSMFDFAEWFKKDMQGVVIHFTDHKY